MKYEAEVETCNLLLRRNRRTSIHIELKAIWSSGRQGWLHNTEPAHSSYFEEGSKPCPHANTVIKEEGEAPALSLCRIQSRADLAEPNLRGIIY